MFPSYTRETRVGIASVQAVSRWKGKIGHCAPALASDSVTLDHSATEETNFEFEYLSTRKQGVLTDTLMNFPDWHLTCYLNSNLNIRLTLDLS